MYSNPAGTSPCLKMMCFAPHIFRPNVQKYTWKWAFALLDAIPPWVFLSITEMDVAYKCICHGTFTHLSQALDTMVVIPNVCEVLLTVLTFSSPLPTLVIQKKQLPRAGVLSRMVWQWWGGSNYKRWGNLRKIKNTLFLHVQIFFFLQ